MADRAPLDRARVLRTAIALADREGLDAIRMRALATELGVVPMALYKHVSDKEDLVDGMVDAVVADYGDPTDALEWRSKVRDRVLRARAQVITHPWLQAAIESRTRRSMTVLGHMEAVAADLVAGGLSVDLVHYAMHALGPRIWGFSPEAFAEHPSAVEPVAITPAAAEAQQAMMRAAAAQFPSVVAIALDSAQRNPSGACDDDAEFAFTLDLLLDAFERLRSTGWVSRALPA